MKKIALLFILCLFSAHAFSQTTVVISSADTSGAYTTGSATATTRTDDAIITTSTTQNGYAVFDLSAIPAGSVITESALVFYVSGYTAGVDGVCNTYGYAGDLSMVTVPATLFSDITGGTLLFSGTPPAAASYGGSVGYDSLFSTSVSAPINSFIQANIGSKVSVGFSGGGTSVYTITGETASIAFAPFLRVTYSLGCTGTPATGSLYASALDACPTTTVVVTNSTTYGTGVTFQWQSSSDSASWTNISGATAASYIFSGLSATTYYRCQNTCTYSGLSSNSAGLKITYLTTCCTGTPPVGVASASTTYCSSCSLTLSLTGYPATAGISYQWQISSDNVTWNNFTGAAGSPYTFTPFGAYYYRCIASCVYSGLSSYSSSIYVGYQYRLIVDTVSFSSSSTCGPPVFYAQANGSPMLSLKTYYGDGTSDTATTMINDTITSHLSTTHTYLYPGTYTVKEVLYYANTPQDSFIYPHLSSYCNILPFDLYTDINGDCIKESGEPYNSTSVKIKVDSSGIPVDTISATSGFYYVAHGPIGTIYAFTPLSFSGSIYVRCPVSGVLYDTILYSSGTYNNKEFALSCTGTPSGFDLAVYGVIPVTGEHDQWGDVYVSNNYCTATDASVTLHYSKKYNVDMGGWLDVSPSPTTYTDSSITWNVTGLSSFDPAPVDLYYAIWSDEGCCGYLTPGDTTNTYITVSPTAGDADIYNNYMIIVDTVRAGCDPNEMSVTPSGCITSDTDGTVLQYTIHFMNVGNDTAFNIYVMDTLSDNVDPKSLQILMASNTMNIAAINDGTHNIVKFDFPQINLLDSAACPQCSGSVIFTVKTRQGLPEGATIFNRAGVYFDYNPVVMTNTVEDIKGGCFANAVNNVKPASAGVQILPNPATDILTIKMNPDAYTTLTITNSIGQQMATQPLTQTSTKVNVSLLPPGLYYITFRGDNGTEVKKFVKS